MPSEYQLIEARIAEALQWREEQPQKPPLTEIASIFKVLYLRLIRRSKGRKSRLEGLNNLRKLTNEQEEAILLYLRRCEEIGL